ncbi:ABC transporter ATP-binding protein [Beijerinckia sp. L45]|uniref:ABC transporter ATP-binding protein n=1 Tax=Beijerinckia sp. L45 TaxID=1641855 RepID=UPI001AEDDE2F|nr:ABC transporter ATP-binding protein [Beijerinckia sp. L45]
MAFDHPAMTIEDGPSPWRLAAVGITKRYGPLTANDAVTLDLRAGEIHAVLGENGAGKSTIMKILYGMEMPDAGTIERDGQPLIIRSPRDAIAAGIGMVHQHFMLVPTLSVLENLILGTPLSGRFMVRKRAVRAKLAALAARYRIDVDLDARVDELSVGAQQRVEILKALVRGARALILDEPTAVLTPREVEALGDTLRELCAEGHGIFIVTHKLAEVMRLSDRVSVMRRGRLIGTWPTAAVAADDLVTHMVGRSLQAAVPRTARAPGALMLEMQAIHVPGQGGRPGLRGLDLRLAAGEILGIAGVDGNGQQELADAITGLRRVTSGEIILDGEAITNRPTATILASGLAHVPEDRHRDAVVLDFPLTDNAVLVDHARRGIQRRGLVDQGAVTRFTDALIAAFAVRCSGPQAAMRSLSGGNQQRFVLARELSRQPKVMIAMQPTRGLDVGAISEVHARLLEQRDAGMAILLVSAELDEILALSDRVAVLREGRIAGVLDHPSVEAIGALMLGTAAEQAA